MLLTVFAQLLKLLWMLHVLTWHPVMSCHVHASGRGILLARGVVSSLLAAETVFESTAGMFLRKRPHIYSVKLAANLKGNDTKKIQIFITNCHYPSWDRLDRTGEGNPTNSALCLHELQMDGT